MNKLIIIFISPRIFLNLSGNNEIIIQQIEKYNSETENTVLLGDNKEIIYINSDNTFKAGGFDSQKVNEAIAVLIPDEHPKIHNFIPNKEFKILHHTTGAMHNLRNDLQTHPLFKSIVEEAEVPNSSYEQIAKAVGTNELSKIVAGIYEFLGEIDFVLEAKLTLLHAVLNNDLSLTKIIGILKDDKKEKLIRFCGDVFKTKSNLQDYLLESKVTQNGNEIHLEERLVNLKENFEQLKAFDEGDIFSIEYQTALEEFRDALSVE